VSSAIWLGLGVFGGLGGHDWIGGGFVLGVHFVVVGSCCRLLGAHLPAALCLEPEGGQAGCSWILWLGQFTMLLVDGGCYNALEQASSGHVLARLNGDGG
jgi:hypothetical protein